MTRTATASSTRKSAPRCAPTRPRKRRTESNRPQCFKAGHASGRLFYLVDRLALQAVRSGQARLILLPRWNWLLDAQQLSGRANVNHAVIEGIGRQRALL